MVGDRTDRREYVLNAMVELGEQRALLFLCSFALTDVDADADYPQRTTFSSVGNETACLNPSDLAVRTSPVLPRPSGAWVIVLGWFARIFCNGSAPTFVHHRCQPFAGNIQPAADACG